MILDNEDILIQAAIDSARYEMVDLGLSVKWANKNVGASHPEDAGLYFQWGDTVGYAANQVGKDKKFYKHTYPKYLNTKYNVTNGLTVLESIDDTATICMGSKYRMPTSAEIQELINNTTQMFIDIDGNEYDRQYIQDNESIEFGKLKGVRFVGSNGNSIFIPAAGDCAESFLYGRGSYGLLLSSSLCENYDSCIYSLGFIWIGVVSEDSSNRYYGHPVRGVE